MTATQRTARVLVHGLLSRIFVGSLTVTEPGDKQKTFSRGAPGPRAFVTVNDPRCWPLLLKGSSGMGEKQRVSSGVQRRDSTSAGETRNAPCTRAASAPRWAK